jgi:hypothetical protein
MPNVRRVSSELTRPTTDELRSVIAAGMEAIVPETGVEH